MANKKFLSVSGSYNLYDDAKYIQIHNSDTLEVMSNSTYYESDSFTFDASTGIFTLVEPVARKGSQLHLNKFYILRDVSGDIVYKLISIKESLNTRVYYNITKYTSILASDSKGQYSTIVGNGTSDTERSNAYTLDWEGNAWFAGDVYVHSTSGTNKDDGSKKLLDTSDLLAFAEEVKDVTIQKPTTAQVGQIVKVKAVDADGKITETEAVDMPTVPNDYELVFQETVAEDVIAYSRDTDKDGNPFSLTDVMVIIFTKPFAESTNSGGRSLGFLPTSRWGHDNVSCEIGSSISSANTNSVGRYNVVFAKVVNGYQVVTRAYESQNTTNVFGVLVRQTKANNEMFAFHSDSTKLMQIASPQGNITCVKIVGYTNLLVSAGTIVALYKRKGT